MPKTQTVEGVELTSGFWWIVKQEGDKVVLRNKRDQSLIVPLAKLEERGTVERRIKAS